MLAGTSILLILILKYLILTCFVMCTIIFIQIKDFIKLIDNFIKTFILTKICLILTIKIKGYIIFLIFWLL